MPDATTDFIIATNKMCLKLEHLAGECETGDQSCPVRVQQETSGEEGGTLTQSDFSQVLRSLQIYPAGIIL